MAHDVPAVVRRRLEPSYWFARANIPDEYHGVDLAWYDDARGDAAFREDVESFLESMLDPPEDWPTGRGLAIFGPPGLAKTRMACLIACARIYVDVPLNDYASLFSHEPTAYFITADGYNRMNQEAIGLERRADRADADDGVVAEWWASVQLRKNIVEGFPLLVFDDVGKEHRTASGYAQTNFHRLLRERYFNGLATVMTSNLTPVEYIKAYGEASMSFLQQACEIIAVDGPDQRGRRR